MAHVVKRGRRPALAVLLALGLAALLAPAAARAAEDEFVPGGAWLLLVKVTEETQRDAIARDAQRHPLATYVLGDAKLRDRVSGGIVRRVVQTDTLLGFGIGDSWNLNLSAPYRSIRQESNLTTVSADPAVTGVVDGLRERTVSGVGNVRLTSLHRPLFSDTDAIVLAWGVTMPGGPPQSDYIGRTTLDVGVPYQALTGAFQYTHYPLSVNRSRVDLRASFDLGFDAFVNTPTGKHVLLHPPNNGGLLINWEQEFETLGYGIFVRHQSTTQTFLGGSAQGDATKETRLGGRITMGNLATLETRPLRLPFQAGLEFDSLVLGYNVPETARYTLFLRTYF
jgi:hypothetical protein